VLAGAVADPPAGGGAPAHPPARVAPIPGGPFTRPTAVLVEGPGRIWVAHHGGVAVHEGGAWRDASAGLLANETVDALHRTPRGEIFATGSKGWRWEGGAWVRRLNPTSCMSPLRLTSLGDLLFGVCAYYSYYVAWPTRADADLTISIFGAGSVSRAAALAGGEIFALSELHPRLLRLPSGGDLHDARQWEQVAVPAAVGSRRFADLWSPAPGRLVIVGSQGLVLVRDQAAWTVEDPGVTDDLQAVWGTEGDGLFAVGAAGRLLHRGLAGWQAVPTGTAEDLVAVHGQPGGRVVVVGTGGAVMEVAR
jgi:hypothetical protein